MALLIKRPLSPFWYARFQVNGKDHWLSTKETDRRQAEKKLKLLVGQVRKEVSIEQQLEVLLEFLDGLPKELQAVKRQEVVRKILRAQDKKLALAEAWKRWLANPNKEYDPKPKTLLGYEAIWKRFCIWAAKVPLEYLHEVSPANAQSYAADLWLSKVSSSTYNQHIKFLRSFFVALEVEAGVVTNPWVRITTTKKQAGSGRRNLNVEEVRQVLTEATGNMRLICKIGVLTGLRLADVVNLKVNNIENNPYPPDTGPRPGMIAVRPKKTERLNKILEVPIHPTLAADLRDLSAKVGEGFLFPREQALHAKPGGGLSKEIQELFERCGIKTTEDVGTGHRRRAIVRVGFHSLRHTFVSLCAKGGAPLHVVQKLVGHGSPMLTSDKYLHLDKEDKHAAIERLPTFKLPGGSNDD